MHSQGGVRAAFRYGGALTGEVYAAPVLASAALLLSNPAATPWRMARFPCGYWSVLNRADALCPVTLARGAARIASW